MNSSVSRISRLMAACALAVASLAVQAQTASVLAPPQNVLQLSASGTVDVQQDLLVISLNAVREGADAATVQNQLKAVLDTALAEARKAVAPGQMDVRTGNFSLYPRHNKDGKIAGWQGSAELVLEGRDFQRITATAGRLQGLTMGNVGFGLSRERRAQVEGDAQKQAIDRFKAKAGELAAGFGFSGYTLREVSVNANEPGFARPPRMMAMEAKAAAADMPVPVEAGKSTVMVTVSGSVQLK